MTAWRRHADATARVPGFVWRALWLFLLFVLPASAQSLAKTFDHDATLFPLRGMHENVRCETCHYTGVFKGTPTTCALCHVEGNRSSAMPMPSQHIPLDPGQGCELCHTTSSFGGVQFSHITVSPGGCNSCHNAYYATGKSAHHPVTNQSCDACHTIASFNGIGLPAGHLPVGAAAGQCSSCHTTTGANGIDFRQVSLGPVHALTRAETCLSCHSSNAIAASQNLINPGLTPKLPGAVNHIPIAQLDCASSGCHQSYATSPSFLLGAASLSVPTLNLAGHATVASAGLGSCGTCHEAGTAYTGMLSSTATVSDVRPLFDAMHPTGGDCGICHTTAPTFSSNVHSLPDGHIPTGSFGSSCGMCHMVTGSFGGFDLIRTHQATGVGCTACHNISVAALPLSQAAPIKLQPGNHIPVGLLDCSSAGCHANYSASVSTFIIGPGATGNPSSPTLNVAGHLTAAIAGVTACSSCHAAGPLAGMVTNTATLTTDVVPSAVIDPYHVNYVGDCQSCHTTTPVFASNLIALPTGHMPTGSAGVACSTCHATPGAYNLANLVSTHATGVACSSCHASGAGPFINAGAAIKTPAAAPRHVPFGNLDCSACHANYPAAGVASFVIGVGAGGSINAPTMNVAAHAAAAGAGLSTCGTCHNTYGNAPYTGMVASQPGGGDQFPSPAEDNQHQSYTGDCSNCHSTTPTFRSNASSAAKPGAHIPTGSAASCASCHTTPGNFAVQDLSATHSATGLSCASCHNGTEATALSNSSPSIGTVIVFDGSPGIFHLPFGTLDCGSCHGSYNGTASGGGSFVFSSGGNAGNINSPSLTVSLHAVVAAQVPACSSCHNLSTGQPYTGMVASTNTVVGDQFPNAVLDPSHQSFSGDCGTCHTTTPTFHGNGQALPNGHIPIVGAPGCGSCHTTAGTYTSHSTGAVHTSTSQACLTCHNPTTAGGVASAFGSREPTIYTQSSVASHIPTGSLDCATSGCHLPYASSTVFTLGSGVSGNINGPSLTASGHTSVLNQSPTPACSSCHTGTAAAPNGVLYSGMVMSTSALAGDTFPPAGLDAAHQSYVGDCGVCHTTTPTFSSNHSAVGGLPTNHIPLSTFPSTPPCSNCHINPGNYAVARMNHSGLSGGCKTCHGVAGSPLAFADVRPTAQPANHIPTTAGALANACENCHRNALTGNFTSFSGTVMDHTGVTSGCSSCHSPGASFYGVTMVTSPNGANDGHQYVATLACENCHTSTAIPGGYASGKMVHSQASGTPCMNCHEISGNPAYKPFSGTTLSFRRRNPTHYYPGGSNGGPDCTTGCHQHSTSDASSGSGVGSVPQAIISPSTSPTLSAANVGAAVTRTVTLTNPGGQPLAIASVGITGSGFAVTNACGSSLASGSSCALTIQFTPASAGSVAGVLTITDNAGGSSGSTQTLNVTGVVATATLSASSVVALTSTAVGTSSAPQAITFSNLSSASITLSTAITGNNAGDFTASNACGGILPASGTCAITLSFKPSASTAATAEEVAVLTISDSGLPASFTLQLLGSISARNGNTANLARFHPANSVSAAALTPAMRSMGYAATGGRLVLTTPSAPLSPSVATALAVPAGRPVMAAAPAMPGRFTHSAAIPGQCGTCHRPGGTALALPSRHMLTARSCDVCHSTQAWLPLQAYRHLSTRYQASSNAMSCTVCHLGNTEAVPLRAQSGASRRIRIP